MHYELSAIIAISQVLEPITAPHRCARVVPLATAKLALIPVTEDLVLELDGKGIRVSPETGFWQLSIGLQRLLVTASAAGRSPTWKPITSVGKVARPLPSGNPA